MPETLSQEDIQFLKAKGISPEQVTPVDDHSPNKLSAEDEAYLKEQGIDPASVIPTDSEQPTSKEEPGIASTVGRTLKRRIGGMVAGGAAGAVSAEALPFAHVFPPWSEAIAGGIGGIAGGYVGQKAQDTLQGEAETKKQEAELEEAAKANPKTALATEVIGSALASGGAPSVGNLIKGGRQALGRNALTSGEQAIWEELGKSADLSAESLAKLVAQEQGKDAIKSIVANAAINPAVNAGLGLATGQGLPSGKDAIAQVVGGALMSGHSPYGRLLSRLTSKPQNENIQTTPEKETLPAPEQKTEGAPKDVQAAPKEGNTQVPLTAEEKAAVLKDEGMDEVKPKIIESSNKITSQVETLIQNKDVEGLTKKLQELPEAGDKGSFTEARGLMHLMEGYPDLGSIEVRGKPLWKWTRESVGDLKPSKEFSGNSATESVKEESLLTQPKEEPTETNSSPAPETQPSANPISDNVFNKVFGAEGDKIASLSDKRAPIVAGVFKKAIAGAEQLRGRWTNKFIDGINKLELSDLDKAQLYKIDAYENRTATNAPASMFRNLKQRAAYKLSKDILADNAAYRQALNIPITRNGRKTSLVVKPNYHPTTLDPKVAEVYKSGDAAKIDVLDKEFIANQLAHGKTQPEAEENLKEFKEGMGGKLSEPTINMARFNGSRLAHDVPLPDSFKNKDWTKNMEGYLNRMAADNSFYEHVESNPQAMEALGEKKDPWGKDIPQTGGMSLANNPHVKAALKQFHGEITSSGARNEKGIGSLAATLFVSNPAIEAHKLFSNLINGPLAQASNSKELAGVIKHIVMNTSKGAETAVQNGAIRLNASKLSDVVDRNVTFAGKLQAISKGIREISSLGGIVDKINAGQMQAGFEYLIPSKLERANAGDKTQQAFLKKLDPDYAVGKSYTPEEVSKLASQALAYTQGTHDIRTMPSWMLHDTEVSGFFKLAHWSISQTNRFMNDVYEPAKKGDLKPMINALFGSLVGGYLIKELREKIQGKHGSIPDLKEVAASERGLAGNKGLVAYNMVAAAQYAGFAGVASQIMKYPFDLVYKNKPQGSVFPMDEIAIDLAKSIGNITTAAANDPHFDWSHASVAFVNHLLQTDVQLARVVYNQGINSGAITGTPSEKKQLADKLGELRRFQQVSGLPFDEQSPEQSNPFMNLEQKDFKRTTDVEKAVKMLPELIATIVDKYSDNPDVMLEKFKALKQNHYETIPSLEDMPIQAMKYIGYLQRKEGPRYAQEALQDFMEHKVKNEVKAAAVP